MKNKECSIVRDKKVYTAGYFDITKSVELIIEEAKKEVFDDIEVLVDNIKQEVNDVEHRHINIAFINSMIEKIEETKQRHLSPSADGTSNSRKITDKKSMTR